MIFKTNIQLYNYKFSSTLRHTHTRLLLFPTQIGADAPTLRVQHRFFFGKDPYMRFFLVQILLHGAPRNNARVHACYESEYRALVNTIGVIWLTNRHCFLFLVHAQHRSSPHVALARGNNKIN